MQITSAAPPLDRLHSTALDPPSWPPAHTLLPPATTFAIEPFAPNTPASTQAPPEYIATFDSGPFLVRSHPALRTHPSTGHRLGHRRHLLAAPRHLHRLRSLA